MSHHRNADLRPLENSVWARLGHLAAQASVAVGAAVALVDDALPPPLKLLTAVLAGALLGWHGVMVYRWRYWDLGSSRFGATMLVAGSLWAALLVLHPAFGVTILGAYVVAACPFLGRAVVSVAGLSIILIGVAAVRGDLGVVEAGSIVLTGLVVVVLHGLVTRIRVQNADQRALISRLRSTQAELARSEHAAGVLSERARLARDIHDSFAQGFTSILMLLEAADGRLAPGATDVRARIDQARQAARENLDEARRVVWSLRPGPLERDALAGALEVLVGSSGIASGTDAELRVEGEPCPLAPEQEVVLYRAAQEALANVIKHAEATRVVCTLTYLGDEVVLDVNDDGRGLGSDGFDAPLSGGMGLMGLRERVRSVGGSLRLDSAPGSGTNLTVAIPTDMAHADRRADGAQAST